MILSGSFTGRRFRVGGKLPPDAAKKFAKALERHAFSPINLTTDRTRAQGWVNARQILDTDVTWDKIIFGEHVVLGLRTDSRRVSRPVLRARIAQAEADRRREHDGGKLGREERADIAKVIEADMLRQTPASTAVHEVAWDTHTDSVWFSSSAKGAGEEMQDLFEKTFGLTLTPLVPHTLADQWVDRNGKGGAALEGAVPADLRTHGGA